jgi:hypothetical protein
MGYRYRDFNNGETTIQLMLQLTEYFVIANMDLKETDLFASDLSITFFFSCDEEWESDVIR